MLVDLVNIKYPDELVRGEGQYITQELDKEVTKRLRDATEKLWPELWVGVKPGSPAESRSKDILREVRNYLQRFWREQDEHARDWQIYRAREYHQIQLLHPSSPSTQQERDPARRSFTEDINRALEEFRAAVDPDEVRLHGSILNNAIRWALDQPPRLTRFELALFRLQRRAAKPSKAPRFCPNPDCRKPYFLSRKKGMKFCTQRCAHGAERMRKRLNWTNNKDAYNTKRRTK